MNTQGYVCNNLKNDVSNFAFHDYNGMENPDHPYPVKLEAKNEAYFQQVEDGKHTSSAGLAYKAKSPTGNEVRIIIAWKNSSAEKKVYTQITNTTVDIDWERIKGLLDKSSDNSGDGKFGLKSTIKLDSSRELKAIFSE